MAPRNPDTDVLYLLEEGRLEEYHGLKQSIVGRAGVGKNLRNRKRLLEQGDEYVEFGLGGAARNAEQGAYFFRPGRPCFFNLLVGGFSGGTAVAVGVDIDVANDCGRGSASIVGGGRLVTSCHC